MSEHNQPTIESLTTEVNTLRQTNTELLRKSHDRGERLKALGTELDESRSALATAQAQIVEMTVGIPMRELAKDASTTPGLWLSAFNAHFKAEIMDGKLTLVNQAGEPVLNADGSPVEPTWQGVNRFLSTSKDETLGELRAITIHTKASGGGSAGVGRSSGRQNAEDALAKPQATPAQGFGLRSSTNR